MRAVFLSLVPVVVASIACSGEAEPTPVASVLEPDPAQTAPSVVTIDQTELEDAASILSGARERIPEGEVDLNGASALFNGVPDQLWTPALTQDKRQTIVELAEPWNVSRLDLLNATDETATSEVLVETGPGYTGPWSKLTTLHLTRSKEWQRFPVEAPQVRFLRITPTALHTPGDYYGLDEFRVRGVRSDPSRTIDFTGTYRDYGNNDVRLVQKGERITGCFGKPNFKIEGIVAGPYAVGTWHDLENETAGPFTITLNSEHGISGVWGENLATGETSGRWDADLNPEVEMACETPVDEQENELVSALAKEGKITLYGVQFDFNKDSLKPESTKVLQTLAAVMKQSSDKHFRIEGHTDNVGGEAYNLDLSKKRATAVKAWLVGNGIPESSLEAEGYGFSVPVLPNDTATGRAANRRVEVTVVQ